MGKLTSKTVESIAKAATPGKTNDGDGLYFQVSKSGGTSWIFRYKLDGRSREMGLGPFPTVTLSQARQLAADQRKLLASGSDPLATRDAAKEAKREAEQRPEELAAARRGGGVAGAAQLVAIGMLKGGANLASILLTTLLLTSQHLLYGLSMRPVLSSQPLRWRLGLGFLLTDEFFALTSQYDQQQFNRWYALGVGLTFYIAWNLFTLAGILLGQNIPHLDQFGLDFSIVATFVALIAPLVRNLATVVCVAVSLFCSVLFSYWHWETALVVAGLLGMSAGFICQKFAGARA